MVVKKEWFASWFDTPYYHVLYKHRDYAEAERFVKKIITHINPPKASKLLDLACGKGRHAKVMADMGYNVTGLDLSIESIKQARKHETENLHFDVHDMREVYKKQTFDYVFNLFTSFGYFDDETDNEKMLTSIYTMLQANGTLVIDFMNVHKTVANLKTKEILRQAQDDDRENFIDFHINRKFNGQHIVKEIEFADNGKQYKFEERVQGLTLNDFEKLFVKAGFKIQETFGNYDLGNYSKETSNRLIMIAKKI